MVSAASPLAGDDGLGTPFGAPPGRRPGLPPTRRPSPSSALPQRPPLRPPPQALAPPLPSHLPLDQPSFLLREPVEVVHQLIDLPIRVLDLPHDPRSLLLACGTLGGQAVGFLR